VDSFFQTILNTNPANKISYQALFEQKYGINPHAVSLTMLKNIALGNDKDSCLEYLMCEGIEPQLGQNNTPTIVYDYPASQASLAKIEDGVAKRFEFYLNGKECANGYYELTCPKIQRVRFEADLAKRKALGLPQRPIDERLLAAMAAGLPDCTGVAVGIDRLLMIHLGCDRIEEVLPFGWQRA